MNGIDALLSRLPMHRQTAPGRWLSRCPAHDDHDPSLSVRLVDDGRILIHCFAGCGAADIVAAVGLELRDLMGEKIADHLPPVEDWQRPQPHPRLVANRSEARAVLYAMSVARAEGYKLELSERQRELSAYKYLKHIGDL